MHLGVKIDEGEESSYCSATTLDL